MAPDDPAAFIHALVAMLDDPVTTEAQGIAGRRFVESWVSPGAVAPAYAEPCAAL